MCSSIKYVLKVIIFSIFILVTGIEKGETLHLKAAPLAPKSPWLLSSGRHTWDFWQMNERHVFFYFKVTWDSCLQRGGPEGEVLAWPHQAP